MLPPPLRALARISLTSAHYSECACRGRRGDASDINDGEVAPPDEAPPPSHSALPQRERDFEGLLFVVQCAAQVSYG